MQKSDSKVPFLARTRVYSVIAFFAFICQRADGAAAHNSRTPWQRNYSTAVV